MNPYEECPVFQNENYLLRLVKITDSEDLLKVYSDEKSVPLFNSDNCHGDDFHYTTLKRMKEAIEFWDWSYKQHYFVRWSIIDKRTDTAVGTIELFNRSSEDYFNNCGLLRLDLRSDYENTASVSEILSLILEPAFSLFDCPIIATKVPPFAAERKAAVQKLNFVFSAEKLIGGNDNKIYTDYYILKK